MTEPDTMTYIHAGLCVRPCSPMRIYVWAYATVCVDRCVHAHIKKNRHSTQSAAKRP